MVLLLFLLATLNREEPKLFNLFFLEDKWRADGSKLGFRISSKCVTFSRLRSFSRIDDNFVAFF